jgi:hypothetical protein
MICQEESVHAYSGRRLSSHRPKVLRAVVQLPHVMRRRPQDIPKNGVAAHCVFVSLRSGEAWLMTH